MKTNIKKSIRFRTALSKKYPGKVNWAGRRQAAPETPKNVFGKAWK
jgi:hypothetical protein